jgi:hypothetical protein
MHVHVHGAHCGHEYGLTTRLGDEGLDGAFAVRISLE